MGEFFWPMMTFYAFCGGLAIGACVKTLSGWYDRRQEKRFDEMRKAIPPTRLYPRMIVEFPAPGSTKET